MGETLATSGGSQVQTWLAAVGFVLFSMVIAATMMGAAKLFAVKSKKPGSLRDRPYECGEEPVGETRIQFHPRYYVVALFFVLFDVEAAFLFPWALVLSKLGVAALVLMGVFMAVLMLGWLYALKKEALRWQ